ncbi:hypothetical protein [Coleofasciculus sp. FACHB-501]|uniref:hypothetical protein n=1 Tax=Cyanophyceae TaxID=3028117 RepID=UPI001681D075|nr:hypothetical protein [Coleofasciculus sp. FACHB-501]MBD1836637.1 hypothetical protein [Coleofasciculus sp. FACHB-501]
MSQRFYVKQFGACWSLSKKGYQQFLEDGSANRGWDLNQPQYEARSVKKIPTGAKPIEVTDFQAEHYKEELEYFLSSGQQTGFKAPNDTRRFLD